MEITDKKSTNQIMRVLHRNIGFFILGFVIIYALSGISLIYRDTDFLKHEKTIKVNLPVEIKPEEVGQALRIRDFKILRTEGDLIYYQNGSFNKVTGEAEYSVKELIFPLNKLTILHKTPSKNPYHWFTLIFGTLMLFMAVSSLWMFKARSKTFRTAIYTIIAGLIFSVVLLFLIK